MKKSGGNNAALIAVPVCFCVYVSLCLSVLLAAGTVSRLCLSSLSLVSVAVRVHVSVRDNLKPCSLNPKPLLQLVAMIALTIPFYKRNLERMGEKASGKRYFRARAHTHTHTHTCTHIRTHSQHVQLQTQPRVHGLEDLGRVLSAHTRAHVDTHSRGVRA